MKLKKFFKGNFAKATLIILVGQMFANALNYFYNLGQGKILSLEKFDSAAYSEFWALNSFSYYFLVPVTALTLVSTQVVSTWYARNENEKIAYFIRKSSIYLIYFSIITSILIIPFSYVLKNFLHINSLGPTVILNLSITLSFIYPITLGAFAGLQKFARQSISYASATLVKLLVGLSLAFFFGVTGAIVGNLVLSISLTVISFGLIYNYLSKNYDSTQKYEINFPWRLFVSSIISTFAISAFLSNDVILAKHYLSHTYLNGSEIDQASIYSIISLFGRIIYFFGITFASIVLPFASYAKAKGGNSLSVLYKTLIISVFSLLPILFIYFLIPETLIKLTFSDKYIDAARYLGVYAISVSIYAISSILINYFIALEQKKFAIIPAFYAILQVVLLLIFHANIYQFIYIQFFINIACLCSLTLYLIIIRPKGEQKQ